MPKIIGPSPRVIKYLRLHGLIDKYKKQVVLLGTNLRHPSLNTELLAPKEHRIYSFRIDKKYRGLFIFISPDTIKILDANDHYK